MVWALDRIIVLLGSPRTGVEKELKPLDRSKNKLGHWEVERRIPLCKVQGLDIGVFGVCCTEWELELCTGPLMR